MESNNKYRLSSRLMPTLAVLPLAVAAASVSAETLEQRVARLENSTG